MHESVHDLSKLVFYASVDRSMQIGYCRVSTDKQGASIAAQEQQLRAAGCEIIYKDEDQSGAKRNRPQLNKALEYIRKGDVLVVSKLDRLSRSLVDLLDILKKLEAAGAAFRSLGETFETESAAGRMMMNMVGCFAQFEREVIVERIKKGLAHARANGRIGGGRYKLSPDDQMRAIRMIQVENRSQGFVARAFGVDRSTVSRMMTEARLKEELKGNIL
jgi:DNA invertase Pin-like site-specific DNA recombinase